MHRNHQRGKVENWLFLRFCRCFTRFLSLRISRPFWTAWSMKKIVKDAVLTYEVTGSASAAEQKLYSGMKKEHIPLYIEDRDCSFEREFSLSSVSSVSGLHPLPLIFLDAIGFVQRVLCI